MYGSDFQLVKNVSNHFSICDRTKGLVYKNDASLDICVQNKAETAPKNNWLPGPPSGLVQLNYRS
jgi:hypothetical protein